jgi:hypothetical protein
MRRDGVFVCSLVRSLVWASTFSVIDTRTFHSLRNEAFEFGEGNAPRAADAHGPQLTGGH